MRKKTDTAPESHNNCVDIESSLELSNGNPQLASEMLTMLLDDLKQKQQGINTHIGNQEFSDARELVHQLHGSSCYCGTPLLKESSKKLEKILATSATDEIGEALTALNFAMDQLIDWRKNHDIAALFSTD